MAVQERPADQPHILDEMRGVQAQINDIFGELRLLGRKEMQLGIAETKEQVQLGARAAALGGIAFLVGQVALFFTFLTIMFALDTGMALWLAALITTLIAAVIAAIAGLLGRSTLQQINPKPQRFIRSMREDYKWLRNQMKSSAR